MSFFVKYQESQSGMVRNLCTQLKKTISALSALRFFMPVVRICFLEISCILYGVLPVSVEADQIQTEHAIHSIWITDYSIDVFFSRGIGLLNQCENCFWCKITRTRLLVFA
jgi:hypothetical protein